jgi:MoaA/NifB/PqqE/SkfB family radical SAM enzyme
MLPWTSIENSPTGNFRPCCIYTGGFLADEDGTLFDVRKNTVEQVMNSNAMQKLRNEFKQGKRPSGCESCWKEEDAGNKSKRQHMWEKVPTVGQMCLQKDIIKPIFLDLKLGNICNLKCRICWAGSSSQWAAELIKTDPGSEKKWRRVLREGAWPREDNVFFKSLEGALPHVKFFEITGGEPLMIKEQFDVLRKCVSGGYAKNIEVHYNTNGTHFPEKELNEIWPHFKRIELAFSIDDIGERFEYQRHPAKWHEVNKNIFKFKESGLKNLSTQICTTINFFNISYLDELAPYVDKWQPDFWYINTLHDPIDYDIQQLPVDVKKTITDKLSNTKTRNTEINEAIRYLNRDPQVRQENYRQSLISRIKQIDLARKENFVKVFPLLNNLMKIYE